MTRSNQPTQYIYVPLRVDLYAELIARSAASDVSSFIEYSVENFLDRTQGDPAIWSAEYIEKQAKGDDEQFVLKYGDPTRGYQWQSVFLPNGTSVKMVYRGNPSYGEIRHGKLYLEDQSMSPSEFARRVANNTSRNAWRDIYIKFPGDGAWKFADDLRRHGQ